MRFTIVKISLVSALSALASTSLAAGYGAAGCGLGSVFFGSQAGFMQVSAATTNNSSGSQTFGISSGTSNCVPGDKAAAFNSQREFIGNNLTALAKEAAQGNGDTLRAFASTLGCSNGAFNDVAKALQAKHGEIFAEPGVDAVLFATHEALHTNSAIASSCKDLI